MAGTEIPGLVTDRERVEEIADELRRAGWFAIDLEFASDGRYIPELCLVQVAWPGASPGMAMLDAQAVSLDPIYAVVADAETEVVAHAARQDVALLAARFEVEVARFWDSQIAAAFAGIGEQVGYGRLVSDLLDTQLDKGPQFTDWARRPLSDRQLRYAAADVTYLRQLWPLLRERLSKSQRLDWVAEESAAMAVEVSTRTAPEEKYRSIGGWAALRGPSAAALVSLAAWREREALQSNKPPSWILPDNAMIELCRKRASTEAVIRRAKGVGQGTVRRYGEDILSAIAAGLDKNPPQPSRRGDSASAELATLAALVHVLVTSKCSIETLPPKLVGSRGDCEALVAWHALGDPKAELPRMLRGWRREFVGDDAIAVLEGSARLEVRDQSIIVSRS